MIDLKTIDEMTRKLSEALPPGLAQAKEDIEARMRTVLTGAFERMNLVSREEFDAKCAELEAARTRLDRLQEQLDALDGNQ